MESNSSPLRLHLAIATTSNTFTLILGLYQDTMYKCLCKAISLYTDFDINKPSYLELLCKHMGDHNIPVFKEQRQLLSSPHYIPMAYMKCKRKFQTTGMWIEIKL